MKLHVGRGSVAGALTVFPVWTGQRGGRAYGTNFARVSVTEVHNGPAVPMLMAENGGNKPILVLEGHLFEGGWQHRMAVASVLLAPGRSSVIGVACVEQGRWGGGIGHGGRGRRATPFVRSGASVSSCGRDRQSEVWSRVDSYVGRAPGNATGSLVGHLDELESDVRRVVDGLEPLPGQAGVIVAIAGQPVMAEVFDDPRTLHEQFDSIIAAAALDALGQPPIATPSRRARRLVERLERSEFVRIGFGGIGARLAACNEHVDAVALTWLDRTVHLRVTNLRHPMLVGV